MPNDINFLTNRKKIEQYDFSLKIYPVAFIGKKNLENGDKIILPPSILENITNSDTEWPLMFQLSNPSSMRKTHCGVMEFIADEGCAYVPYWMMQNLAVSEGEILNFKYSKLEKGNYVKFQPQTEDFLKISNPKAVLEATLRNFTCLTKDDMIALEYNSKIFWLNIIEVKPGNSVSIIETDVNVDFISPNRKLNKEDIQKKIENVNSEKSIVESYEESSSTDSEKDTTQGFKGNGHKIK